MNKLTYIPSLRLPNSVDVMEASTWPNPYLGVGQGRVERIEAEVGVRDSEHDSSDAGTQFGPGAQVRPEFHSSHGAPNLGWEKRKKINHLWWKKYE